jgi:hypothetical protein
MQTNLPELLLKEIPLVSRQMQQLRQGNSLWKKLFKHYFPQEFSKKARENCNWLSAFKISLSIKAIKENNLTLLNKLSLNKADLEADNYLLICSALEQKNQQALDYFFRIATVISFCKETHPIDVIQWKIFCNQVINDESEDTRIYFSELLKAYRHSVIQNLFSLKEAKKISTFLISNQNVDYVKSLALKKDNTLLFALFNWEHTTPNSFLNTGNSLFSESYTRALGGGKSPISQCIEHNAVSCLALYLKLYPLKDLRYLPIIELKMALNKNTELFTLLLQALPASKMESILITTAWNGCIPLHYELQAHYRNIFKTKDINLPIELRCQIFAHAVKYMQREFLKHVLNENMIDLQAPQEKKVFITTLYRLNRDDPKVIQWLRSNYLEEISLDELNQIEDSSETCASIIM